MSVLPNIQLDVKKKEKKKKTRFLPKYESLT